MKEPCSSKKIKRESNWILGKKYYICNGFLTADKAFFLKMTHETRRWDASG